MSVKKASLIIYVLTFFTFFFISPAFSQSTQKNVVVMDGLVYGYNYEPSKKLLQKEKQIKVEGVLDNVDIRLLDNGKVVETTKTKANGTFLFQIKTDKVYLLELSKAGYTSVLLSLDFTAVPKELLSKGVAFSGAELILNSYQSKNKTETYIPFGKLFFNSKGNYIDFESAKFLTKKQREYVNNPVSLMMRSVQKNKGVNKTPLPVVESVTTNENVTSGKKTELVSAEVIATNPSPKKNTYYDTINKILFDFKLKARNKPEEITDTEIQYLEDKIEAARIQFEKDRQNVQSPEDSVLLEHQLELLNSVELELLSAKKIIALQENEISVQKKLLFLAIFCVLLLSVMLFLIFRFNKEKKKTYLLLKEKNKKITDSINYASRIQESVLPSDAEIKMILPQSFIYYQPRDVVSGDFYWLSTIQNKTIVACVDCTGHGVPGAFMSLIGNTLLNEIVNEKQILDPAAILNRLHLEVVKSLNQNTERANSKDGMEMSLCVIDRGANIIEYSGAMNPLYVLADGAITVLKPDMKGIGGESGEKELTFSKQTISIQKNMSVYMFTDGYMDQFGGSENKKFNIPNFKKMLIEMQSIDMEEQKMKVRDTIQLWKGNGKQIDDMLVIGIRF